MTDRTRRLTTEQLLAWADDRTGVMRVNTDRDVLPGGFMAALSPLLVAWPASEITPDAAEVVLRNLNYGGNPFERTTILHSVRLVLEAVESAELVLVPSTDLGRHGPVHHVQLRFIFETDREPVLLRMAEAGTGTDARIPDLVLSWESWRAPDEPFGLIRGMGDPGWGLSLRAYAGAQRYLEDSIRGRSWFASPLRLPGGRRGVRELLAVALALGDGVARNTIAKLLDADEQAWLDHAPAGAERSTAERWADLRARLPRATDPELESRLPALAGAEESYHALVRSCATLSRYLVLLAAHRVIARGEAGDFDASRLPAPTLDEPEPWMSEVASTDIVGIFMRAPAALGFVLRKPESVPGHLPEELYAAGLVAREGGRRVEIEYARDKFRPYGSDGIRRHP